MSLAESIGRVGKRMPAAVSVAAAALGAALAAATAPAARNSVNEVHPDASPNTTTSAPTVAAASRAFSARGGTVTTMVAPESVSCLASSAAP